MRLGASFIIILVQKHGMNTELVYARSNFGLKKCQLSEQIGFPAIDL